MKLLLADGDKGLSDSLRGALDGAGFQVVPVSDGLKAFEEARRGIYDLLLLDLELPTVNGMILTEKLREAQVAVPILVTGPEEHADTTVEVLDRGADDFMAKPLNQPELMARIRALLRRAASYPNLLTVADLVLDPTTRRAVRAGKTIALSSTEFILLEFLMRQAGRVVSRTAIVQHVWPHSDRENDNVLDVYVSYVRAKVDKGFPTTLIHTVRGAGYVVEAREGI